MADPFAVLLAELHDARAAAVAFDDAWPAATLTATRTVSHGVGDLRAVLDATEDAWRLAYTGSPPSPGDRALARLGELLATGNLAVDREPAPGPTAVPVPADRAGRKAFARRMRADGYAVTDIATILNVSRQAASQLVAGVTPGPPRTVGARVCESSRHALPDGVTECRACRQESWRRHWHRKTRQPELEQGQASAA